MSFSRRSLLRQAAAASAAACLPRVADALLPAPPPADSLLVLLEGPWLIFQPSGSSSIRALSLGGTVHHGAVSVWRNGQQKQLPPLPAGAAHGLTITARNCASTPSMEQVFYEGAKNDPVLWVKAAALKGASIAGDPATNREVTLPVPHAVYLRGFLQNATVTEQAPGALKWTSPRAHIVTIFEYIAAPGQTPSLEISSPSGKQTLTPGDHLVVRMQHSGHTCGQDAPHAQEAFATLASYLPDHAGSPLVTLSITKDTAYDLGGEIPGISDTELGLKEPQDCTKGKSMPHASMSQNTHNPRSGNNVMFSDFANCAGPSLIVA